MKNYDSKTVKDFGSEWSTFSQKKNISELKKIYNNYFKIFPFNKINKNSFGFDAGCGSGRWAQFIAPNVKELHCIEPSKEAINVAKINLKKFKNCKFINSTIDEYFSKKTILYDFGYCLGVLHHIPNTQKALNKMAMKLKKNSPLLLYIYYNFENKSLFFKCILFFSNLLRIFISKLPLIIKKIITDFIALIVYFPMSKINKYLNLNLPLSYYKDKSFYVMRTDSLDRFGTRLEKRFSKTMIIKIMENAHLKNIQFYKSEPYWVVIGYRK